MASRILRGTILTTACVFLALAGCTPKQEVSPKTDTVLKTDDGANLQAELQKATELKAKLEKELEAKKKAEQAELRKLAVKTDLALEFAAEDVVSYTVTSQSIKIFKFEMPSSDKFKEDISDTTLAITFDQKIEAVDSEGVAIATITIKGLKHKVIDKGEEKYNFDSDKPEDQKAPLGKLLGASYKITIDSMGKVGVLDVTEARNVVKGGVAATKAKGILSDKAIVSRHQVVTLGSLENSTVAVGDTWSTIKTPPYKLLMPRTFEKVYKLETIDDDVAVVTMNAIPAGADKDGQVNPAMMMFSSMLDAEEKFTGIMKLDPVTGKLISQNETLNVKYIATDPKEDAEPDVLTITLEYSQKLQLVK